MHTIRTQNGSRLAGTVLAAMLCMASAAFSQSDIFWDSAQNGTFGDGQYWTGPVAPGAGDTAIFDVDGSFTVSFDDDAETSWFDARDGVINLNLGGNEYTVDTFAAGALNNAVSDVTITNGTLNQVKMFIGSDASSGAGVGAVVLTGAGAVWNSSHELAEHGIGYEGGTGEVRIQDGAVANWGNFWIGSRGTGSEGRLIVTGADTQLNMTSTLYAGMKGGTAAAPNTSYIEVSKGATLNQADRAAGWHGIMIGRDANSTSEAVKSQMLVDDATVITEAMTWVGRTGAHGEIIVRNGSLFRITRDDPLHNTSDGLRIDDTGVSALGYGDNAFRVQGSSRLEVVSSTSASIGINIGQLGRGILEVDTGGHVQSNRIQIYNDGILTLDNGTVQTAALQADEGSTINLTLNTGVLGPAITVEEWELADETPFGGTATLVTTGDGVTLNLALAPNFSTTVGSVFTILSAEDAVIGEFAGLNHLDRIPVDDHEFEIRYGAEDITLHTTMIPEPGTLLLLLGGAGLLAVRRRLGKHRP